MPNIKSAKKRVKVIATKTPPQPGSQLQPQDHH